MLPDVQSDAKVPKRLIGTTRVLSMCWPTNTQNDGSSCVYAERTS